MDRLYPYRALLRDLELNATPPEVWNRISMDWFKSLLKEAEELQTHLADFDRMVSESGENRTRARREDEGEATSSS